MTNEEIEELARTASPWRQGTTYYATREDVAVAIVAAIEAEREACVAVAHRYRNQLKRADGNIPFQYADRSIAAVAIALAIEARTTEVED